ncbi:MAG: hypothetical protein LKG27_04855 [Clostridiaceae bacterium]|nr:hypothetical protein [Clostridiaceae bacterium]
MKRLIILFTLIFTFVFSINSAFAGDNSLNAILLEKVDGAYNVVLRSDARAKISKHVKENNNIELTVKGMSASSNVPILYRNVPDDSSLVIENNADKGLKIDIQAPNVSDSNIIFETPNSSPVTVDTNYTAYMVLAAIAAILALVYATKTSNKKVDDRVAFDLKIKDREMRLLKKYREELTTIPSINYDINKRRFANYASRHNETLRKREYLNRV